MRGEQLARGGQPADQHVAADPDGGRLVVAEGLQRHEQQRGPLLDLEVAEALGDRMFPGGRLAPAGGRNSAARTSAE